MVWLKGKHTFVGIEANENINQEIERMQGCGNPLWMDYEGKKLLLADTSFAPCPGQIEDVYIVEDMDGWEWRNPQEILVFDV
jgi:hypothetical protein